MIVIKQKGDYSKTNKYLKNSLKMDTKILEKYGQMGVNALIANTPVDSGVTAASWSYKIENNNGKVSINFINSNRVKGVNIAIILQYGHGTRNGGWVEGRDYINPAIQPVFDKMADEVWREVRNG